MSTTHQSQDKNGTEKFAFGLAREAWDMYLQYRPPYPDTQWQMWLDYHQGPLDVVHEIGTGCGVGMANFLQVASKSRGRSQPVRRAILSDPSQSNILTVQATLPQDQYPRTAFALHQQPAEASFLAPGSVDMVFACECLHYTDIDACLARMNESLRPGGTMAATFYDCARATVVDSPRAERAFQAVFSDFVLGAKEGRYMSRIKQDKTMKGRRLNLGLNWVPLDPERWADVSRVYINIPDGEKEWPLLPAWRGVLQNISRVNPETERLEWIQDQESWGVKKASVDWFRGLLATHDIEVDEAFWKGPLWTEWVEAVSERGGTVWLVIQANYIMARKK